MEEVIFKLAGGNIPKGIYQNMHSSFDIDISTTYCSNDITKNFARWGSMLKAYLYALY